MALTKTKSLTISVVVLSVLLAVALIATIVLAAFSFTAKASTTFNFAGSVSVQATNGLTENGVWKANLLDTTGAIGAELNAADNTGITQGIALAPIKIKNTSSKEIKIAVAVVISGANKPNPINVGTSTAVGTTALADSTATTANFGFGTTAPTYISAKINDANAELKWATYTLAVNAETFVTNYINTGYDVNAVDKLAGTAFDATFYITAVYSNQDLESAIKSAQSISTSWTVK